MDSVKTWFEANDWWLSSSGWLIGLVGVVLAMVAWVRPYRSKMLVWDVISNSAIAKVPTGAGHELEITYSGKPVKSAHLLVVQVRNGGREAVEIDDYAAPVAFEFSDRSELLTYAVVGESTQLDPTFRVDTSEPRRIELNPLLLNSGDWLDLQFVTDGPGEVPSVTARVANQTKPIRRPPVEVRSLGWRSLYTPGVVLLGAFMVPIFAEVLPTHSTWVAFVATVGAIAACAVIAYLIVVVVEGSRLMSRFFERNL